MRISILTFLIAFSFSCFAQNWNLINSNYEYHYALNGEYNTTIKVDSFEVNGSDTTFFLNRIVSACDSCIIAGSDEYLRYNQPTFLQRQVLKQGNDFTFSDTASFLIKSNENLNTPWVFDAANNVNAEIIAINQETIFGITDSVKTILLSTNDTINISENFGIVSFQDYHIIGLEKTNSYFGFKLPKFQEFYNFNLGAVFQYKTTERSGSNVFELSNSDKYVILSKDIFPDSIVYNVNHFYNHFSMDFFSSSFSNGEYLDRIVFYKNKYTEAYNNELFMQEERHNYYPNVNPSLYAPLDCFYNTESKFTKQYGIEVNSAHFPFFIIAPDSNDLLIATDDPMFYYNSIIEEGIGLRKYEYSFFEYWGKKELVGYIKNGIQTGEVWEDSIFTSVNELEKVDDLFTIYPSPAQNTLKLSLGKYTKHIDIQITNILGEIVLNFNSKYQSLLDFDISNFSTGVYFIKVETDKNYGVQKFMKK